MLPQNLRKPVKLLLLLIIVLTLWITLNHLNYNYNILYFDTNDILGNNLYIVSGILFYMILITVILIIYLVAKNYLKHKKLIN